MRERCRTVAEAHRGSAHVDLASCAAVTLARDAVERGAPEEALALARPVLTAASAAMETVEQSYALCVEAALALADNRVLSELESFVAALPPARATPLLRSGRARLAAEEAHRRGEEDESERHESEAIELLRSVGARPLLAKTLLERAARHEDAAALAEARSIYSELGATRWLERLKALLA